MEDSLRAMARQRMKNESIFIPHKPRLGWSPQEFDDISRASKYFRNFDISELLLKYNPHSLPDVELLFEMFKPHLHLVFKYDLYLLTSP